MVQFHPTAFTQVDQIDDVSVKICCKPQNYSLSRYGKLFSTRYPIYSFLALLPLISWEVLWQSSWCIEGMAPPEHHFMIMVNCRRRSSHFLVSLWGKFFGRLPACVQWTAAHCEANALPLNFKCSLCAYLADSCSRTHFAADSGSGPICGSRWGRFRWAPSWWWLSLAHSAYPPEGAARRCYRWWRPLPRSICIARVRFPTACAPTRGRRSERCHDAPAAVRNHRLVPGPDARCPASGRASNVRDTARPWGRSRRVKAAGWRAAWRRSCCPWYRPATSPWRSRRRRWRTHCARRVNCKRRWRQVKRRCACTSPRGRSSSWWRRGQGSSCSSGRGRCPAGSGTLRGCRWVRPHSWICRLKTCRRLRAGLWAAENRRARVNIFDYMQYDRLNFTMLKSSYHRL